LLRSERAEEYRKAAALRGWQLAFDHIEYRYSGTTDGGPGRCASGSANHLIIAVLWKHGLKIATPYGANDLDHFARVARLGARLAKASCAGDGPYRPPREHHQNGVTIAP